MDVRAHEPQSNETAPGTDVDVVDVVIAEVTGTVETVSAPEESASVSRLEFL